MMPFDNHSESLVLAADSDVQDLQQVMVAYNLVVNKPGHSACSREAPVGKLNPEHLVVDLVGHYVHLVGHSVVGCLRLVE